MKTLREIKREKTLQKYKKIYTEVQNGVPLVKLFKKYGYKNVESLRAAYYQLIIPIF